MELSDKSGVNVILTYQDFLKAKDRVKFIAEAIADHRNSLDYKIAQDAELYERQENSTINSVVRYIYSAAGTKIEDPTTSNNKLASNFFHRLNTQRVSYLLGNGISFTDHVKTVTSAETGEPIQIDETKEALGDDFDTRTYQTVYSGEILGKSYCYITYDSKYGYNYYLFPFTEFVPLLDENDGELMAGIRFWSLDWNKRSVTAVLYEVDGFTTYKSKAANALDFEETEGKRGYNIKTVSTDAMGEEVVGYENHFSALPIVPYYGRNKKSTLIGMKASIDAHDIIQSGFANDLQDCAQIYWLIGGSLGMDDKKLKEFRERLLLQHIGVADLDNSSVTPYTQQVPHEARTAFLRQIRNSIYEAFGALDVTNLYNGDRTATEIEAAYEALEQETDDLEARVTDFIRRLLKLIGIDDMPVYKRNRISNQLEQTQMIIMAAEHLSERAVLEKLPWITVDEIDRILAEKSNEVDNLSESVDNDVNETPLDGDAL